MASESKKVDSNSGWVWQPLHSVKPPEIKGINGFDNPIDAFVQERLIKESLNPAPSASRLTLLRRAYFDLLGLPPPPEEVERFAKDLRPDAYERLIDHLLSSPHYGEHWGRHWLDVARYADTAGFETDSIYPNAWRYRDFVIRSLNVDKPWDRFIEEQVAGDELWPERPDAVLATGLYCVGPALGESAMVTGQLDYEWLTDAVDTTGAAFLGLTLGCARCHDHKYDPISQRDYFGMQAIFAASDRPYPNQVRQLRIKVLNGLLSEEPVPKKFENDLRCTIMTDEKMGLQLYHRLDPITVHRLGRGELNKPHEKIGPAFPTALGSVHPSLDYRSVPASKRRVILAKWLTSPDNPMTARVLVNRVWGWNFGQAIIRTPNDFGAQGEIATHPELLDWLAKDFMDHGWSLKYLHRRIMLSSTYQSQSAVAGPGSRVDPENRLLWHFPRQRLEGEALRDNLLACSGSLDLKLFGPPVVPSLTTEELTGLFDAPVKWPITVPTSKQARRSIYVLQRRTFVYPIFAAFDSPELMTSCPRRLHTVVPTQALTLLNSPLVREQASYFARRLLRESGPGLEEVVARAWLLAFGRPVTLEESKRAMKFLQQRTSVLGSRERTGKKVGEADQVLGTALEELCLALFNANEFIFVD